MYLHNNYNNYEESSSNESSSCSSPSSFEDLSTSSSSTSLNSIWSSALYLPCLFPNLYEPLSIENSGYLSSSSCSSFSSSLPNHHDFMSYYNNHDSYDMITLPVEEVNSNDFSNEDYILMNKNVNDLLGVNTDNRQLSDITNSKPKFVAPRFEKKWLQNQYYTNKYQESSNLANRQRKTSENSNETSQKRSVFISSNARNVPVSVVEAKTNYSRPRNINSRFKYQNYSNENTTSANSSSQYFNNSCYRSNNIAKLKQ